MQIEKLNFNLEQLTNKLSSKSSIIVSTLQVVSIIYVLNIVREELNLLKTEIKILNDNIKDLLVTKAQTVDVLELKNKPIDFNTGLSKITSQLNLNWLDFTWVQSNWESILYYTAVTGITIIVGYYFKSAFISSSSSQSKFSPEETERLMNLKFGEYPDDTQPSKSFTFEECLAQQDVYIGKKVTLIPNADEMVHSALEAAAKSANTVADVVDKVG